MSDVKTEENEVQFTINGQAVVAEPGETVLSAAKRYGIHIPTLCHHDALSPQGACRLCVVEAHWGKRSKLVTSCIYMPWEGDVIETDSARVHQTRRIVLELLMARSPEVEVLQELGAKYGVETPRFRERDERAKSERCILCGLCVRVCAEVVGQSAIGYANRGMERIVTTPFADQADECIGCGACVFVCPTDALHYEDVDGRRIMKELHTEVPLEACHVCGRPFASEKQIARVRERLNLPDELAATCPACRGRDFRGAMERTLGVTTSTVSPKG